MFTNRKLIKISNMAKKYKVKRIIFSEGELEFLGGLCYYIVDDNCVAYSSLYQYLTGRSDDVVDEIENAILATIVEEF